MADKSTAIPVGICEDVPIFFNDTATTEIYTNLNTLSLHDALPISNEEISTMLANYSFNGKVPKKLGEIGRAHV